MVLCAVFVLIALGWIVTGLRADSGELHEAPVVLVGPDVVTVPLVKQVIAVPGRPFSAGAVDNRAEAAALLERGDVVAELDIDLSGTQDQLRLATPHRPALARAIQAEVERIEKTRGRTVVVAEPPDRLDGRPLSWITFATALAGFLLVCVVSLVWGPFARTLPRLLARLTALAFLAVGAGICGWLLAGPAPAGERMLVASVLAATVVAAGALTFACEIIGGLPGLLLAATVIVAGPVPLLLAGDRLLLADAWAIGSRWTIAGAGESLLWAASGDGVTGIAQPVVTIAGSALLGLVVLVAMRWLVRVDVERPGALASVRSWRRNLGLVLASATCLTILATALTSALHSEAVPRPLASLASTTQCVPAGPVEDVGDLNRITRLRAEPALQGGDVGVSAHLSDGRSIWMFGDTLRDAKFSGAGFVRNSMLLVEPDCLQVVLPKSGAGDRACGCSGAKGRRRGLGAKSTSPATPAPCVP